MMTLMTLIQRESPKLTLHLCSFAAADPTLTLRGELLSLFFVKGTSQMTFRLDLLSVVLGKHFCLHFCKLGAD